MRATAQRGSETRASEKVASHSAQAEIDQLNLVLAAFNKRITELEKREADSPMIETLRASAILLARQIDELRCALATHQLAGLLAR